MSVEAVSLWPADFGEPVLLTPLAILRQQGAALGEQTKNLVIGRVTTNGDANSFIQLFSVFCAPLGYQTTLFVVNHGIDLYPARVSRFGSSAEGLQSVNTANNSEELKAILKELFARPSTNPDYSSV
jgi:hypothetical protein